MKKYSIVNGSSCNCERCTRWIFRSIGILIAKAMSDAQILGVTFSNLLLSVLRGVPAVLSDLQTAEPEFYSSLNWILSNDVTEAELAFSVSYEGVFGESLTIPLGTFTFLKQKN